MCWDLKTILLIINYNKIAAKCQVNAPWSRGLLPVWQYSSQGLRTTKDNMRQQFKSIFYHFDEGVIQCMEAKLILGSTDSLNYYYINPHYFLKL